MGKDPKGVLDLPISSWNTKETLRPSLPSFTNEVIDSTHLGPQCLQGPHCLTGSHLWPPRGWNRAAGHLGPGCCVCTLILVSGSALSTTEGENVGTLVLIISTET